MVSETVDMCSDCTTLVYVILSWYGIGNVFYHMSLEGIWPFGLGIAIRKGSQLKKDIDKWQVKTIY